MVLNLLLIFHIYCKGKKLNSEHTTDILEKLANRTISYFNKDLSIEVENKYTIEEVSKINFLDISTLISLSKDMIGTIGMSVSNKLAFNMVEGFIFGEMSEKELHENSSENVAETLNIILGNIIQDLNIVKNGGKVNISTPYTMHSPVTMTKKQNGKMYLCKLKANNGQIQLSYMI